MERYSAVGDGLKMLTWIMFQSQPAACDHVLQDMYFSEGLPYLKPLLLAF